MTNSFKQRIVITGIGLTAPNGNSLDDFRHNLLNNVSGIQNTKLRYIGEVHAGICNFDALKYQNKRDIRMGTRAGSIAVFCANEALADADIEITDKNRRNVGIFIGITENY